MLTQERLKELLSYNAVTGVFTWRKTVASKAVNGTIAGCCDRGYIKIVVDKKAYFAQNLVILYVEGYLPEGQVDHKDRIRSNNIHNNLRPDVTSQCQMRNRGNFKNNKSGVKGVCFNKTYKKWQPGLTISRRYKSLGLYDNFEDAVCARLAGEQCVNWAGCDSSSPAFQYVRSNISRR